MAKTLAMWLLFLQLTSFIAFAEHLETLPPTYPPHHSHSPLHPPTKSPHHPPSNAPHHHHHHHNHTPSPAPSPISHTPSHPPHHSTPVPAKPPTGHHHHHHPPAYAPVKPPIHTPVVPTHPPLHPPVPAHPPLHPSPVPRCFIAVQGVVYVKSCKYAGVHTLLGAKALHGAVVKLQCNSTKYKFVQTHKTDKNGYFFIEGPKSIKTYAPHKCNVVLVSAPNGLKPSNLNGGLTGAALRSEKPYVSKGLHFTIYTVGPLAFEPKCPR
ncbi:non-classical arabinogalactan protein 31-like [Trifolium pratense]|uniref:non-classical arabinogalactan protein 31-like n=1 Tax=Trifolium pratense TaxID=57577 RepID=UPI001E698198|nr:non-classical arabinogalactan protein 31-like [Trifolium pratense]